MQELLEEQRVALAAPDGAIDPFAGARTELEREIARLELRQRPQVERGPRTPAQGAAQAGVSSFRLRPGGGEQHERPRVRKEAKLRERRARWRLHPVQVFGVHEHQRAMQVFA